MRKPVKWRENRIGRFPNSFSEDIKGMSYEQRLRLLCKILVQMNERKKRGKNL